jgi:Protein of unknown function (DUF4233)
MTLAPGNPMRSVLMAVLAFQVIVFGLAIPVMIFVSSTSIGTAVALGVAAALVPAAGAVLLRWPVGYLVGWLAQLVGLALGFVTPGMFAAGGLFAVLWVVCFILGKRIESAASGSPEA